MKLKRSSISDEIPTSSMADIAFLLIIYFMVTTSFSATRGLDFGLPKDDDQQTLEIEREEAIHIQVQPGDRLLVDGRQMQLAQLLPYLQPKLTSNPGKPVILQTDPQAPYGSMVAVLDELRTAKDKIGLEIANISIPTQREIESFWY
jgi:biopolymer transport protein ExbD